ncbi:MAG TPA: ATP-binding protein [Thermodesulfobacteriota bacterium]|nr:ATP-binding protein [Thermodesulfobacteriota bacterium]HNU70462.1 ATP-binding protein [Thermodesulfobacteriota bacterium]
MGDHDSVKNASRSASEIDQSQDLIESDTCTAALLLQTSEKAFLEIFGILGSSIELDQLLRRILVFTLKECKADQGSILLISDDADELQILASKGLPEKIQQQGHVKRNGGIADWVIRNNQPLILNDDVHDPRFRSIAENRKVQSALCLPLRVKGTVIGTVNLNRTGDSEYFGEHDQKMAMIMASQMAVAIDNARLHETRVNQERLAAIGETVSGLAHCIKNILTVILNGSSILDYGIKQNDLAKVAKGWDMVKNSNQFLSQLVLDMLTYSKDRLPEYRTVNINDTCQSVCQLCRSMGRAQKTTITFDGDPSLASVQADEKDIKRCLMNILVNAMDACIENGGVISVSTSISKKEGYYCITVKDTGCGIPEEHKKQIFDVFFSTKGSKGTGLGLAVTKKIIEEHNGSIDVESEIDKGTTFIFSLPRKTPSPAVIRNHAES